MASQDCSIQLERDDDLTVLTVSGDLDLAPAGQLLAGLVEARQPPMGDVIVDLRTCDFFDVLAMNLLAAAARRLLEADRLTILVGPTVSQETASFGCVALTN